MKLFHLLVALLLASFAQSHSRNTSASYHDELVYDYIVVGSGAGGGPLACRLAMAGNHVLLIEAGNDQGGNVNISVPAYQTLVTEDPKIRWDMFVNHYPDQDRAMRDPHFTWETDPFEYYLGTHPPYGAKPRGLLYPRAGTLGGCVTHNALVFMTPNAEDWDEVANLTGDYSWAAENMTQYLEKLYEWLPVAPSDPSILFTDLMLARHIAAGASFMGGLSGSTFPQGSLKGLASAFLNNPNGPDPSRDSTEGFFQIPLILKDGARVGVRDFINQTVSDGWPLEVRQNCFVTRITFDESASSPVATGVKFLDGEYLYHASPLSVNTTPGVSGSASATKEVIVAGGTYNTPQLLKLSGIGPADELDAFNISVVKDLPGVGTNMQDRYEVPVNVMHSNSFVGLNGCTFDGGPEDLCLSQWLNNSYAYAAKGPYATNGFAAQMAINSDFADNKVIDLYILGGPVNFQGYFPGWVRNATESHRYFSWLNLKAHTRNRAGTVQLNTADPLDQPLIDFNYFDTGDTDNGEDELDLQTLVQGLNMTRQVLLEYGKFGFLGGTKFVEVNPGPDVTSQEDLEQYVKDRAWGHHASCSCPIGSTEDPNGVLDSQFRVLGVDNLRVVDASVFPKIPGSFIQAAILMVSEKAADVILNG